MDSRFRNVFSGIGQVGDQSLYRMPQVGMPPTPSPTTRTGAEIDPISGLPMDVARRAPNTPMDENPWNDGPPPPNNNPEDKAYKAFMDLVNNFPVRKEPSTLRKIGASIAALSGNADTVEHALYPRYDRDVADWKQKAGVSGNLAQIEASRNSAVIRDEYNHLTNSWRLLESERKADADKKKGEQGDRRLDQGDRRLDIQQGTLDLKKKLGEGAKGIRVNQSTGQTYLWYADGHIETIDQQDLSFAQRQKLAQAGKLELLDLQQAFTRERDETKHEYTLDEIAERAASRVGNNQTEADKIKGKLRRAGEYARAHPEVADWIEADPDTGFIEMKPRGLFRDKAKDADQIAAFNKYIDPGVEAGTGAVPGNNTGSVTPGAPGASRFNRNTPPKKEAPKPNAAGQPTMTVGPTPPPIEKRKVGDKHTWNSGPQNGKTGTWNGSSWDIPVGGK